MQGRIRQINVGGNLTGLVGLDEAMSRIAQKDDMADDAVVTEILDQLAQKNYIPGKMMPAYRKAILREYKIFRGEAVDEEETGDLRVVILGGGCMQCTSLETVVREVLAERNLACEIVSVTDAAEIGRYGVMGLPALVINSKVVSVGFVPDKRKIRGWLDDAVKNHETA